MTTDSFLFRDCTSGVLGHHGDQLGKGSCNPLLVFQLKVLWYQDFTGTFIYESLHYITMLFSRTVSHIPRMCFCEIHVKINITIHYAARAMGAVVSESRFFNIETRMRVSPIQSRSSRRDREFLTLTLRLRDETEKKIPPISGIETRSRFIIFTLRL